MEQQQTNIPIQIEEQKNKIEFSTSSKGFLQFSFKVYHEDIEELKKIANNILAYCQGEVVKSQQLNFSHSQKEY